MSSKKTILAVLAVWALVAAPVTASSDGPSRQALDHSRVLTLPTSESDTVYLGKAVDPESRSNVEGYAIIRYKKGYAKPGGTQNGGSCYGFIGQSTRWRTSESWVANATNSRGLDASYVVASLGDNIVKWEAAATKDILGNGALTVDSLVADTVSPDGLNEVYFADVDDAGAIAVTIVWGIFSGPPSSRRIVEWDQVYDDVDFGWSATGEAGKMDFESIATHELGHSVGMADLYSTDCATQTMYGYASEGEINKRTLEAGDITGVKKLYR